MLPTIDNPTLIDIIFVNNLNDLVLSGNIITDLSDHFTQFCIMHSTQVFMIFLYLFGILHEAEFILRHLSGIINKTISKVAILKVLYHALKLRVHSDKEACGLRLGAVTTTS